jgi:hypothetical protein
MLWQTIIVTRNLHDCHVMRPWSALDSQSATRNGFSNGKMTERRRYHILDDRGRREVMRIQGCDDRKEDSERDGGLVDSSPMSNVQCPMSDVRPGAAIYLAER